MPRITDPLRDEHRRLRRAFAAILVAAAPAALLQACEQQPAQEGAGASPPMTQDAAADARSDAAPDATSDGDAGFDAAACLMTSFQYDAGADVEPGCQYTFPCGLPDGLTFVGCDLYTGTFPLNCSLVPDAGCTADAYTPGPGGSVDIMCPDCLSGGGRRPRGLRRARGSCAITPAGAYFARMAHDEAASVHAFRRLRDDLLEHGAPPALSRAAERSARDEVRHARAMERHARRAGASIPAPRVRRGRPRSLESIARENAVEGCVNETFGALIAAWQAAHAPSAALRATFARIAADEARHAALSWAVARWADAHLDAAARRRVAAARARAVRALEREAPPLPFDAAVGRPGPTQRRRLLGGMLRHLALAGDALDNGFQ